MSCAVLLTPPASGQRRHPSLAAEEAYHGALAAFAAGSAEEAALLIADLEYETSANCVRATEHRLAGELVEWDPEAVLAQAYLRLAVRHLRQRERRGAMHLFDFERAAIGGLLDLGELYVGASRHRDARSIVAGLLTYMAHGVAVPRSRQRLTAARKLLEQALELDESHRIARYSLAIFLELQGYHGQALEHLEELLESAPDDYRFRLRRAVVTVKAGRHGRARGLLEELTREGPLWSRDLATQELARLLVAGGHEDEAVALLREGLDDLPHEKLSLQLAALLDPDWYSSSRVLAGWLAEPSRGAGPTARWVYESGAHVEVETLRRELGAVVSRRAAGLAGALSRLTYSLEEGRKTLAACR